MGAGVLLLYLAGWCALLLIAGVLALVAEWFSRQWAALWAITCPGAYRAESLREEEGTEQ